MQWNYPDSNPFSGHTGSWTNALGNVLNGARYLSDIYTQEHLIKSSSCSRINNIFDDATTLGKLNEKEKFDSRYNIAYIWICSLELYIDSSI